MSFLSDLKVLYHMVLHPIRGGTHAERLDSFYEGQAEAYDDFRRRLLRGREELFQMLPVPEHGVWVDMGGGTGYNLEHLGDRLRQLRKVYVVDLSSALLRLAAKRVGARGWNNVELVQADVTTFTPPEGPADVVTFSYSLTMIPDWFSAVDQAWHILRPGGFIGVVDFYVSRKYPAPGQRQHSWFNRSFWPVWMALDNVYPSPDHVPYLHRRFRVQAFHEHTNRMPYLLFLKIPYYQFVGVK